MPDPIQDAVTVLWNHHRLRHALSPADGIVVFGSNDLRVAEHAADLHHRGLAPWVLFSGARGRMTAHWKETEAEAMARTARHRGVPESAILVEPRATNTGENIRFSRALLAQRGLHPKRLIAVQKPYMERRTFAALAVQWPDAAFEVSSPDLGFDAYCTAEFPRRQVIEAVVGDFQRLIEYPKRGFASPQPLPPETLAAFDMLVRAGYTGQLA